MQSGWCLICGSGAKRELARGRNASAAGSMSALRRFVLCGRCGHVYRDPLPDGEDLWRAITSGGEASPVDGDLGRWLADEVEPRVRRRRLLAVGCGGGERTADSALIETFRRRGWDVCEVPPQSPTLAWLAAAIPRRAQSSDPVRKFSLILRGGLERLVDPLPRLLALRRHLSEDGWLFVFTPNLLDPAPAERLPRDLFGEASVRLYSPGMARTVLARSGFRTEQMRAYRRDRTLGLLARPAERAEEPGFDDPAAIQDLFRVLQWPGSTEALGWNLAALAETQPWVLPALCRRPEGQAFVVRRSGRCLLAVEGRTEEGRPVPIVRWGESGGSGGESGLPAGRLSRDATIVQLGLGSGEAAARLAERLTDAQHLFIWEADPELAKTVLRLVDLSPLWLSTQVSLVIGSQPGLPPSLSHRLQAPAQVYTTPSARQWNPWAYRQIVSRLNPLLPCTVNR